MTYETDYLKLQAFKYKDPFAADKFFVCNTELNICCRPNCSMGFSTDNPEKIQFIRTQENAVKAGFQLCQHCQPDLRSHSDYITHENFVMIDLNLLIATVEHVNKRIGFIPPLLHSSNEFYKNAIMQLRSSELKNKLLQFSYSDYSKFSSITEKRINPSKSELEHLKLIDMACRHIALAALSTLFGIQLVFDANTSTAEVIQNLDIFLKDSNICSNVNTGGNEYSNGLDSDSSSNEDYSIETGGDKIRRGSFLMNHQKLKTKKRRGGALGFKELAAKSQLSPWHFHRTFKSMTGITPKQYGDKCFKYLDTKRHLFRQSLKSSSSIIMNAKLANPSFCY